MFLLNGQTLVNYVAQPIFLLSDAPSQEVAIAGDDGQMGSLSTNSLLDPTTIEERTKVIIRDSFSNEKLLRFGELTFQNRRIPKGIIQSGANHLIADFIFDDQVLTKNKAHLLEHQMSNWDNQTRIFAEQTEPQKKFGFQFTDTISQYTGQLLSDTYIKSGLVAIHDSTINITGLFKGSLTLDSTAIVQTAEVSAFYLKVSAQGKIMGFQLVEKIDTTQGVQFSELVKGKVILSSGYDQGAVKINGQLTTLSGARGIFIAKMGEQSSNLIQDISMNVPVVLKGLAYSTDTTQIGLVIQGLDTMRSVGNHLIGQSNLNQLSVASLSAQGVLRWSRKVLTAPLNLSKLAFTNGGLNGLFLGLTFQDSLKLYGHKLYSKGQTDIAIIKFDPNGSIIQVDTFGTPEEETISQMMLSENLLFFGGEMNGPRKIRSIGLIDFINESAFDNRVYISAILDTLGTHLPAPDTSAFAAVQKTPLLIEQKEIKELQRSVSIFAFPNPFEDELTLQFHAQHSETWSLRMVDNLGSVIKQISQPVTAGFNSTKLSTVTLLPGMYFLQCVAPDGFIMQTIKVIKTK